MTGRKNVKKAKQANAYRLTRRRRLESRSRRNSLPTSSTTKRAKKIPMLVSVALRK